MRFDHLHRGVTLLITWLGFGSLFMSAEFGLEVVIPSMLIPVAGLASSRLTRLAGSGRVAGAIALLAGLGAGWMASITTDYLLWAITFAVFLAVMKSLFLRVSGDFMQMYALSFLSVMAAAVVNPGLSFGVLMLPYTVLLVFSLVLNNLRRSIEKQVGGPSSAPGDMDVFMARKGIIGRRFVAMTTGVTLVVFLASIGFFFLFPRMGLGFFSRQQRKPTAITGFSEQVTLGDFGNIADDQGVVMRVVPNGEMSGSKVRIPLRMKGQSLDTYDGRSWRKTTAMRTPLNMYRDGVLRRPGFEAPDEGSWMRDVYLEPMSGSVHVMFGEPVIAGFKPPTGSLDDLRKDRYSFHTDFAGDFTMTGPDSSAVVYTVQSMPGPDDPTVLREAGTDYPARIRSLYLPLPAQQQGVVDLARSMTAGLDNPHDISVAIESALKSGWEYSLDSRHGDVDPLADFLLTNRTGHCEYFASGMVVLLRLLGVPARIVNGFYGGVRNDYGDYVALRRADAHSWVEVYFPGHGWVTFDPTPASALDMRRAGGFFASFTSAVDAMRLTWYRWVVEYDLEKQFDFLAGLLSVRKSTKFGENVSFSDVRRVFRKMFNLPWGTIFGVPFGLAILFAGGRWLYMWFKPGGGLPAPVTGVRQYRRMRRLLKKRGMRRSSSETQMEFAARCGHRWPQAAEAAARVAAAYVAVLSDRPSPHSDADLDRDVASIAEVVSDSRDRAPQGRMTIRP